MANITADLNITGEINVTGDLKGTIEIGGGGGGTDNLPAVMFGLNTTPTIACPDSTHKTFVGMQNLTSITLTDATAIANSVFAYLPLQSVSCPNVVTVDHGAFYHCFQLATLSLPSAQTIGENAFEGAFNEEENVSLTLPECLTIESRAFCNAGLKSLSFPKAQTIGEQILQDSKVTTLSLPAVVTLGEGALRFAHELINVSIPNCVSLGNEALNSCGFSSIRLPKVSTMGTKQFAGNEHIRDVYLGYNGVVAVTKGEFDREYGMFDYWGLEGQTITIHVPAEQLTAYQSDATWTEIVAEEAENSRTIVFVGDYV